MDRESRICVDSINTFNLYVDKTQINKHIMIESILMLMAIIVPSFLLGYYWNHLMEKESKQYRVTKQKKSSILPPIE